MTPVDGKASGQKPSMRVLRMVAIVTLATGIVLLLAVASLPLVANTGFVKGRVGQAVLESRQRTLSIDGDLSLSFSFSVSPAVTVRLGRTLLSEHAGTQPFASLEGLTATVQLLPLLSGQFVSDGVAISGLKMRLVRRRDGTLNIADLLDSGRKDESLPRFSVTGVRIADAALEWHEESDGRTVTLHGLQLTTGRLANAAADALTLSTQLHVTTGDMKPVGITARLRYDYDLDRKRHAAERIEASLTGLHVGNLHDATAQLAAERLSVDMQRLAFDRLTVHLVAPAGKEAVGIDGRLSSSLTYAFSAQTLELPDFSGRLSVASLPPLAVEGQLKADLAQRLAQCRLSGQFDESRLTAAVEVRKFQPLALETAVTIDRLDLDRYAASVPKTGKPGGAAPPSLPEDIDLRGTLEIGELKLARVKMRDARLAIHKPSGGRLAISQSAR